MDLLGVVALALAGALVLMVFAAAGASLLLWVRYLAWKFEQKRKVQNIIDEEVARREREWHARLQALREQWESRLQEVERESQRKLMERMAELDREYAARIAQLDDSLQRSKHTLRGRLFEALAPMLPDFPARHPQAIAFIGGAFPADYLILDEEEDGQWMVKFVEVKQGRSSLSERERRLRNAIQEGRVRFLVFRREDASNHHEGS